MSEENKAIARRIFEEIINQGSLARVDELIAPSAEPEALKQDVTRNHAAFPEMQITVEDMIAEGDKVVVRWIGHGTHKGEFLGIAPSGEQVTFRGVNIVRIAGGKVVEHWDYNDQLGLMQQLGVIPQDVCKVV